MLNERNDSETQPAELANYYFQNQSCDPFTSSSQPCELGNYASYSIAVANADDALAGLRFAEEKNVRLVVKTTGHDYLGKSSGPGSLSLWMWRLKEIKVVTNYTSAGYNGPAITVGAGVIAGEALQASAAAGYRVVGGECATVGLGAGYTQGGGHSILSTAYGLAADQVLEWELVTASGHYLVATPTQNEDLYWALSGGGGGTYGVVLSMTAKIYPDGPVAGGSFGFNLTSAGNNQSLFWEAVEVWHTQLPALVGDRNNVLYNVMNDTFGVFAFTLPDQVSSDLVALVGPFTTWLEEHGITYSLATQDSVSYANHYNSFLGPLPYGSQPLTQQSTQFLPRSYAQDAAANAGFVRALRSIVTNGSFLVGCNALAATKSSTAAANSVLPAWRDSIALCGINAYWDYTAPLSENLALKSELVNVHIPAMEAATPGSGVYLNEVDPLYKGDWKTNMYGSNYDRLLQIKHEHDPSYLFYGHFGVGSDEFTVSSDGRLCKA